MAVTRLVARDREAIESIFLILTKFAKNYKIF